MSCHFFFSWQFLVFALFARKKTAACYVISSPTTRKKTEEQLSAAYPRQLDRVLTAEGSVHKHKRILVTKTKGVCQRFEH